MSPGIVISLVVVAALVIGAYAAYQRFVRGLAPDTTVRPVNGARLTSERLHELPTPPWRFVFEIGDERLAGVDHVIIGPSGVIAVHTVLADRPVPAADTAPTDPIQLADVAMLRAGVDELAQRAGSTCDRLAKVFWGSPRPDLPAAIETSPGSLAVEGQRLTEWLSTLPPGPLTPTQIDAVWQAIVTGIGRPDPLA